MKGIEDEYDDMWPAAVFSTTILFVFYILARKNMRQRCLASDVRGSGCEATDD